MSSRSLGTLTLDLAVKAGAFAAGMTAAERAANKSLSAMEKRAYKFGQVIGTSLKVGAAMAATAFAAISVAVGQAINNADSIRDLSIRTGIATEKLSEYAYAAKQTGTDIDGLGRGFKLLSKNIAEAADPNSGKGKLFAALGVEVKDAAGNLKQLDAILPEIANKFKLMEDGTTKAALAQELFGKSGADLIEFLNQGGEGLDEMGQKARDLGVIISGETAAAADEFNDRLADLKARADGFSLTVAAGLLPQLNLTVAEFEELVRKGDLAANVISLISSAAAFCVGVLKEYNNAVSRAGIALDVATEAAGGFLEVQRNIQTLGFADGTIVQGANRVKDAYKEGQRQLDDLIESQKRSEAIAANNANLPKNWSRGAGQGRRASAADIEQTRAETKALADAAAMQKRLGAMFGGGGGSKRSSGGKSDAQREAEKLKDAVDRLNASYSEQIALFGQTTEVAKLRYDLENTELSKLSEAEKESLLLKAEKLDSMREMEEMQKAADARVKSETEAYQSQVEHIRDFIESLRLEGELYGMNNIEREKAIALRYAGVAATEEEKQAISELIEQNEKLRESYEFAEDVKDGLSDMFVDFISGAKSAKDAFGDFADQLFKRALQFVADKAIQAMFDAFSNTGGDGGGGAGGGGWGGFFQSLMGAFGGGRAAGGNVNAGMFYRVNENGPEMLSVSGKDYLMMGNQSGVVTPNRGGGGGVVQNNKFVFAAPTSQRTQDQVAQRSAFELSQAQRRNS